jgi:hypothetical protein
LLIAVPNFKSFDAQHYKSLGGVRCSIHFGISQKKSNKIAIRKEEIVDVLP